MPRTREAARPAVPDWVDNVLELDAHSVWVVRGHGSFAYSDGLASERYLNKVLAQADDLSSTSVELEKSIQDWPSEYHLSPKRSQLLRPFEFVPANAVLE